MFGLAASFTFVLCGACFSALNTFLFKVLHKQLFATVWQCLLVVQDDWAVPADDDENDDAQAMDAEDTPQAAPADGAKARPPEEVNGVACQQ